MMRRYTLGVGERTFVVDVQELTADRFEVVVGEQRYDVTLAGSEDLPTATITPGVQPPPGGDESRPLPVAARRVHGPVVAAAVPATAPSRAVAARGVDALKAPMPGLILELNVKPGDAVQRGQQVAVLEAMKMHNFIGAPRAGVIAEVCVAVGQAVGHGEAIVRFETEPTA
jgi:glutaconyl-CoA/methylmalonyl-CoA decarboxylase subunit gamma